MSIPDDDDDDMFFFAVDRIEKKEGTVNMPFAVIISISRAYCRFLQVQFKSPSKFCYAYSFNGLILPV